MTLLLARTILSTTFRRTAPIRYMSSTKNGIFNKVAFLGAGKMAQAMITPLIATGLQPASDIAVFDVSTSTLEKVMKINESISQAPSITQLVDDADMIVCAVKPQNLDSRFFGEINSSNLREDATLLSIIAGTPMSTFLDGIPKLNKMVRCMPNTPAQIGKGVTVWCGTPNIDVDERKNIKDLLCCFGKTVRCL